MRLRVTAAAGFLLAVAGLVAFPLLLSTSPATAGGGSGWPSPCGYCPTQPSHPPTTPPPSISPPPSVPPSSTPPSPTASASPTPGIPASIPPGSSPPPPVVTPGPRPGGQLPVTGSRDPWWLLIGGLALLALGGLALYTGARPARRRA